MRIAAVGASRASIGKGELPLESDPDVHLPVSMNVLETPRKGLKAVLGLAAAKARYRRYVARYGSAAPAPYEIVWVDPADIEYCTLPSLMGQLNLSQYGSHIVGGEWDRQPEYDDVWYTRAFDPPVIAPFESHALYRSMKTHFEDGVPWEDTEWYRWIEDGSGSTGQYPSLESAADRMAEVDQLFEFIRTTGYRTQRELKSNTIAPLDQSRFPYPEHYEIDVNIGRSGELFFNFNGRHRLAIAKILKLDRVPVRIFTRHREWQRYRTAAAENAEYSDIPDSHPDIQRLVSPSNLEALSVDGGSARHSIHVHHRGSDSITMG